MFDISLVADMTTPDQEPHLVAKQQVNKEILDPKFTQSHHEKNTKRFQKTVAWNYWLNSEPQNVHTKQWFKTFIKTENFLLNFSLRSIVSSFYMFVADLTYCYYFKCNSCVKTNMVSTRKKRQSNRRFLSQIDEFDQDNIIGNAASDRQQNVVVNGVNNIASNLTTKEILVNVQTLQGCFNESNDRELSNMVDIVKDRIQNAISTAIDNIITNPRIELAARSINASCGRNATSVTANSERGERIWITASFENVSQRNNTLHVLNTIEDTRKIIPDEVIELSVPCTHFERQPHTHHSFVCFWNLHPLWTLAKRENVLKN